MLKLGVNIDHVATLREARYRGREQGEPDPVAAALACEAAGAHGITAHLREDRRHIQDRDVWKLREAIATRLNLEMANAPEIISLALKLKPNIVCLVPEKRQEVTTEGGLDVAGNLAALRETRKRMNDTVRSQTLQFTVRKGSIWTRSDGRWSSLPRSRRSSSATGAGVCSIARTSRSVRSTAASGSAPTAACRS